MSKKHFIKFAAAIKELPTQEERNKVAKIIISVIKQDAPNFDEVRFKMAANAE